METQEYIEQKKEIQQNILEFINDESEIQIYLYKLKNIFKNMQLKKNTQELILILRLISKITKNHHRTPTFFEKIEQILTIFKKPIQTYLSNSQLFNIFKNNKRILLFLIEQKYIIPDQNIADALLSEKYKAFNYHFYFFYEFQTFFTDKDDSIAKLKEIKENRIDSYCEKRRIGENHHYICELIRNDLIDEFISFVNHRNVSLLSTIPQSIYETNLFLNRNKPTLIEYSVFFGSIQVFKYLFFNNVELTPSLWIYSIHGKNPEIIHFLEENKIIPDDSSFIECLIESIKCHHIDITNYFLNNCMIRYDDLFVHSKSFQFNNYLFFPTDMEDLFFLDDLCRFNYVSIVNLSINKENINKRIILKKKNFYKISNH